MRFIIIDSDIGFVKEFRVMLQEQMKEMKIFCDSDIEILTSPEVLSINRLTNEKDICIITEINLGYSDGLSLAKNVRRINEKIPLVFCTTTNDYAMECYDLDITYYMLKPVTEESVRQMLLRVKRSLEDTY